MSHAGREDHSLTSVALRGDASAQIGQIILPKPPCSTSDAGQRETPVIISSILPGGIFTLPGGIFALPGGNFSLCGGIFALSGGMFACLAEILPRLVSFSPGLVGFLLFTWPGGLLIELIALQSAWQHIGAEARCTLCDPH